MKDNKNKKSTIIIIVILCLVVAALAVFVIVRDNSKKDDSGELSDEYVTEDEEAPETDEEEDASEEYITVTEWPASEYSEVPVFEADEYYVKDEGDYIDISVDSEAAKNLDSYIDELKEKGAETYLEDTYSYYGGLGDIEIQVFRFDSMSRIIICAEETVAFDLEEFEAFPLPEGGRLTGETYLTGDNSCLLTYRNMSFDDIKDYVTKLSDDGFEKDSDLPSEASVFIMTLTKDDMTVTIDYHGAVFDSTVRFSLPSDESDDSIIDEIPEVDDEEDTEAGEDTEEENTEYLFDEETGHYYYLDENGEKVIVYQSYDNILPDNEDENQPVG